MLNSGNDSQSFSYSKPGGRRDQSPFTYSLLLREVVLVEPLQAYRFDIADADAEIDHELSELRAIN